MFELTTREKEVLEWVKQGKSNVEIGMILGLSGFTVKNHVQHMLRRANCVDRAHLVFKVMQQDFATMRGEVAAFEQGVQGDIKSIGGTMGLMVERLKLMDKVLRELVVLKRLKTRSSDPTCANVPRMRMQEDYLRRKPAAWQAAMDIIDGTAKD